MADAMPDNTDEDGKDDSMPNDQRASLLDRKISSLRSTLEAKAKGVVDAGEDKVGRGRAQGGRNRHGREKGQHGIVVCSS